MVSKVRKLWAKAAKRVRTRAGAKQVAVEIVGQDLEPEYQLDRSTVSLYEKPESSSIPGFLKLVTMARAYGVTIADFYREMGIPDSEICGHHLSKQDKELIEMVRRDTDMHRKLARILKRGGTHALTMITLIDQMAREEPLEHADTEHRSR